MKLIIERLDSDYYVYCESENHHKVAESERLREGSKRLSKKALNDECNLDHIKREGDFHMVFDLR